MQAYELLYYVYLLFYGVYASMRIACGRFTGSHWRFFSILCPALLLLQGVCLQLWGVDGVWLLYPLIVHLPIALALILNRRVRWDVAVVSIAISYALCQLPRWIGLVVQALALTGPAAVLIHLACCLLLLLLLDRFCLGAIRSVVVSSAQTPLFFGAMPIAYYLYEYASLYTQHRYTDVLVVNELMPTGVVLFYVVFVIAYRREAERNRHAERQNAALEGELSRAQQEIAVLRDSAEKTAVYRHDFRHHLTMIDSLLSTGGSDQAAEYIRRALGEIDALVPSRFCEHETVNLLLSAFQDKAKARGVTLNIRASLPGELSLPETELCTLLSNGLENALNAAAALPEGADRTVSFFGGIKQNHLLLEIRNPYAGEIVLRDGLPRAQDSGRHYGCRSIQLIVQRRKGDCSFLASDGVFVLQVAIPL